jgi:YHS domain-containing protein
MMGEGDVYGLVEKKCAVCGKTFIPAPMHVYKRKHGSGGHTKWFCSYHCMLAWDKEHPRNYTTMK